MKKVVAVLSIVVALFLTGCGNTENIPERKVSEESGRRIPLYEDTVMLNDGRSVTCIALQNGHQGGLSCDWDGAKR